MIYLCPGPDKSDPVYGGHDGLLDNLAVHDVHHQAGQLALLLADDHRVIRSDRRVLTQLKDRENI